MDGWWKESRHRQARPKCDLPPSVILNNSALFWTNTEPVFESPLVLFSVSVSAVRVKMSRSPGNAFKRRRLLSQTQQHAQVIQESESESEPESSDFSADEAQEQPTPRRATQTQSRRDVVADTEDESDLEEEDEPVVAPRPRASKARDAHERIQDSEEPQAGLEGLDNNHDHLGEQQQQQQQQDNTDEAAQDAWSSFAEEYYDSQ